MKNSIIFKYFKDYVDIDNLIFVDSASVIAEGIHNLHNYILIFLILIIVFIFTNIFNMYLVTVSFTKQRQYLKKPKTEFIIKYISPSEHIANNYMRTRILFFRNLIFKDTKISSFEDLELYWTYIPTFILIFIAIPSFALLYTTDEIFAPAITLKVIGHQWYWSYEVAYSPFISIEYFDLFFDKWLHEFRTVENKYKVLKKSTRVFDSYMLSEQELKFGDFRLLMVDNFVELPANINIRIIVTSMDVLHSWAIPSFGIKIDAVPGRLNQVPLYIKREGLFFGQCSELCGVGHGFMPIMFKVK